VGNGGRKSGQKGLGRLIRNPRGLNQPGWARVPKDNSAKNLGERDLRTSQENRLAIGLKGERPGHVVLITSRRKRRLRRKGRAFKQGLSSQGKKKEGKKSNASTPSNNTNSSTFPGEGRRNRPNALCQNARLDSKPKRKSSIKGLGGKERSAIF